MEIARWAAQILEGERLEDKLLDPGVLEDTAPVTPVTGLSVPARAPEIAFSPPGVRVALPRPGALGDPHAAAALLHLFANHELLAIEAMALVLLRFPGAPPAFRRGLARILREEQIHFQLYQDRMAALGHTFGEHPRNRFLWDCLRDVESIEDYAARMALTIEAANLDHARSYAAAFRAVGDQETAAILDRIHDDEQGHVAHGLRWFRRGLAPGDDLFERWSARLRLPLTPARGRGDTLDLEGRRAAGMDGAFLSALSVYAHSKGRPPTVWWFNPEAELQVLGQTPGVAASALARDLDLLPLHLCATDDALVVSRAPRLEFLRSLQAAGAVLPQIVVCPDRDRLGESALAGRKIRQVEPWAWSPWSGAQAARLGADRWRADWAQLYDKRAAAALLAELAGEPGCTRPEEVGVAVTELAEAEAVAGRLGGPVVLKAPFGTAGRGARIVDGAWTDVDRAWAESVIRAQGGLLVEPWLERVLDLSIHLDVADDVRWVGISRFATSRRGRYLGSLVGDPYAELAPEILRFLHQDSREKRWLERVGRRVAARVGAWARGLGYRGPLGVDALVHRVEGGYRLRPLVEVNPRWTMGRVALALRPRLAQGRRGVWAVLSRMDLKQAGATDVTGWAEARQAVSLTPSGQIEQGVWFTTDPVGATTFVSALAVADTSEAAWGLLRG